MIPRIVGILNCTPDSFYDGGRYLRPQDALRRAERLVEEGADLLDIGGESSRPGSDPVSAEEEARRVLPVIQVASQRFSVPISVDTCKPEVARAALAAGAAIINDVTGLRFGGEEMARLLSETGASVVLMHMQGVPKTMQDGPVYRDVVAEVRSFLRERAEFCRRFGVPKEKIFVDPGIGFGKTAAHNLEILRNLSAIASLGYPVWIGVSRKGFIGALWREQTGSLLPAEDRLEGTLAASLWAAARGAAYLRTHDAQALRRALSVWESLRRSEPERTEAAVG